MSKASKLLSILSESDIEKIFSTQVKSLCTDIHKLGYGYVIEIDGSDQYYECVVTILEKHPYKIDKEVKDLLSSDYPGVLFNGVRREWRGIRIGEYLDPRLNKRKTVLIINGNEMKVVNSSHLQKILKENL